MRDLDNLENLPLWVDEDFEVEETENGDTCGCEGCVCQQAT